MDSYLTNSWKEKVSPFNGEILFCDDLLPIKSLHLILINIVVDLKENFLDKLLIKCDDWHEHDGFISTSSQTDWRETGALFESEMTLYNSRHRDTFVRKAIYTQSGDFLLRYYILDENEDFEYPGIWGDFDITASPHVIREICMRIEDLKKENMSIADAKSYFDKHYVG